MVGKQGRSKKKKRAKNPEIIMAHIPNAGMASVKRKHWKLLETNTLPLGRNHMHLQTNNAKTHTLSQQIELANFPTLLHRQSEYKAIIYYLGGKYEHLALERKTTKSRFPFYELCDDFSQRSEGEQ